MQGLINRTSEITESAFNSAVGALYLSTYLGFSYMAMSMLTSFVAKLLPSNEQGNS